MKRLVYVVLLSVFAFASCSKPEEGELTILLTTDVHGLVLPYNFLSKKPAEVSQANVHAYVDQLRQKGENVILLDAGDMAEGQPSTYYYNNVANKDEHIVGRTANYMGYDALGIGENDIQFGEKIYKNRMPKWFESPIVCANAIDIRTGKPMFQPYAIVKRGGFKVAVIGLTSPNMRDWLTPIAYEHIHFEELDEAAAKWIAEVKANEKPDLIIGLFHIKSSTVKELLSKVSGFDLVMCGQDHVGFCDYVKDASGKEIAVVQPLPRCEEVGQAKLHLKKRADDTYDIKSTIERVPMNTVKPNEAYSTTFNSEIARINNYLDEPLGTFTCDLIPQDGLVGPSVIVNAIHEMQLWISGAEVSLTNFLATIDNVPAGQFTMRNLFNVYKFENQIWTMRMTGEEIHQFLEHAYGLQYNTMTGPDDHLIAYELDSLGNIIMSDFGPELKTVQYNYSCAAGIRYTVDVSKPAGERVEIIGMSNGQTFDPEAEYRVAMNDHQAVGGGGHTTEGLHWNDSIALSRIIALSPNDIRMNFSNYIRMRVRIVPNSRDDWQVIPKEWFDAAAPREKKFLSKYLK